MSNISSKKIVGFNMVSLSSPLYGSYLINNLWIEKAISMGNLEEYHLFCAEEDKEIVQQKYLHYKNTKVFIWSQLLPQMQNTNYLSLQCFGAKPFQLYALRNGLSKSFYPICTITHSLSYCEVLQAMLMNMTMHEFPYDTFICTTNAAKKALINIINYLFESQLLKNSSLTSESIYVIPHGIDCKHYQSAPEKALCRKKLSLPRDAFIILSVGRFSSHDKIDYQCLIRAFADVCNRYKGEKELILFLAGDDKFADTKDIYKIARDYNIEKNIKIFANFPEEYKVLIYKAADIFISLSNSIQECFGLTVLEAMASGLPIITTDWDGYKDLITDNSNGLLVKTAWGKSSDEAILLSPILPWRTFNLMAGKSVYIDTKEVASKIDYLISHPNLRERLGNSALQSAKQYSWEKIIPLIETHWKSMHAKYLKTNLANYPPKNKCWYQFNYKKIFSHYISKT